MDWGLSEALPIFKDVETGVSLYQIGNWIGSYPFCYLFLDIDMMASLSIGIWNWIGVYLRSCLSSKMPKQGFPCIGLEIGLGHILCVISFLDIDIDTSEGTELGFD